MTYVLLAVAIACEVTGTVALRLSEGFTKLLPGVVTVCGYAVAIVLLGLVMKRGLEIGIVYAIWSACGIALVALVGFVAFDERLTWVQVAGVGCIVAGVAALELGASN